MVGAEAGALAKVEEEAGLAGAIPMFGVGLGVVCHMAIHIGDMELVTRTMVMVQCGHAATIHGRGTCGFKMFDDQFLGKFSKKKGG